MTTTTGFSDVDRSGRSAELVDYVTLLASRLGDFRREGYELLGLRRGTAFLDVGCGAGEVCVEIAAQVGAEGRVAGIDLSAAMIEAAQTAAANAGRAIDLRVGSAYELPFADKSFDAVRAERCAPASRRSGSRAARDAARHKAGRQAAADGSGPRTGRAWRSTIPRSVACSRPHAARCFR